MTITPYESPIDSLQKLVNTNLVWGGTSITWTFALQESRDPVHQKYVSKFIEMPKKEIRQLVKRKNMAIVIDKTQGGSVTIQGYIDEEDSKFLMIMNEPLYYQYSALIASKTWPYMQQLNQITFLQAEGGIRSYWEHQVRFSYKNK